MAPSFPASPAREPWPARPLTPPVALTIGGSDSGGGAGIQADLKTFAALQVHGCSAITCVTAQNTRGVERVDALPPEAVAAQVAAVLDDLPVAALKSGMLLNRSLIVATAGALAQLPAAVPRLIDPVMVSRAGAVLLEPEAVAAYVELLLPAADLLTPNIHEARLLSGLAVADATGMEAAVLALAALGPRAVLLKGGGLPGFQGVDLLWDGTELHWLRGAWVDTPHSHGSGCTLGAAITAELARGKGLLEAVGAAKTYVERSLRYALAIGGGQGPLCHWSQQLEPDDPPG